MPSQVFCRWCIEVHACISSYGFIATCTFFTHTHRPTRDSASTPTPSANAHSLPPPHPHGLFPDQSGEAIKSCCYTLMHLSRTNNLFFPFLRCNDSHSSLLLLLLDSLFLSFSLSVFLPSPHIDERLKLIV